MLYGTNAATPSGSSAHGYSYLDIPKDHDPHLGALVPHAANSYVAGGGGYYTPQGGGGAPPGGGTATGSVNNPTFHPIGYNQAIRFGLGINRFRFIPTGQGPRISFGDKKTPFPGSGIFSGLGNDFSVELDSPAYDVGLSGFFGNVGNFFKRITTPPAPVRRFEQKQLGGVVTKTGRVLAAGTVGAGAGAAAGFMAGGPIGALVGGAAGATYGTAKGIYGVVSNAPQGRTMYQTILPSLAVGAGGGYLASLYSTPAQVAFNAGGVGGKLDLPMMASQPGVLPASQVLPSGIVSQGSGFYSGSMLASGTGFGSTLLTLTGLKLLTGQGAQPGGAPIDFGGYQAPSQPIYPFQNQGGPLSIPYNAGGGSAGATGDSSPAVVQAGMDTTQMIFIGGVAVTALYLIFSGKKKR